MNARREATNKASDPLLQKRAFRVSRSVRLHMRRAGLEIGRSYRKMFVRPLGSALTMCNGHDFRDIVELLTLVQTTVLMVPDVRRACKHLIPCSVNSIFVRYISRSTILKGYERT